MASVAQRIRDAALVALRAIPGLAGRVYADRVYPVTAGGSLTLRMSIGVAEDFPPIDGAEVLEARLLVLARAGGTSAAETVSALAASTEAAISGNSTLAQLGLVVEYLGSQPDYGTAETQRAQITSAFRVVYVPGEVPEPEPLDVPEISAVAAAVGQTAIRLECDTDRDCRIQCRVHKLGESRCFYSAMEAAPKSAGHSVLIEGLTASTTYRAEVHADAAEDPDLDWSLFTDGLAGPDWDTLDSDDEPYYPGEE